MFFGFNFYFFYCVADLQVSAHTLSTQPPNGGMQNGSSVGICTRCIHVFAHFGVNLYAQLVLSSKISALELRKKFIESALLVGYSDADQLSEALRASFKKT